MGLISLGILIDRSAFQNQVHHRATEFAEGKNICLEKEELFCLPREVPGTNKKTISLRPLRLRGENPNLDKSDIKPTLRIDP